MKHLYRFFVISFLFYSVALHSLNLVRPNTVVATVNVGVTPDGIAFTPDGRYAYVANNNNYGLTSPAMDSVTVIDVATNLPVTTIFDASFDQPFTVTMNPAGTKAYVTNSAGTTVSIIDTRTNTVIGTIPGFSGPSGMAINSSGTIGYVNNYNDTAAQTSGLGSTISVVNLVTNTISPTINILPAGPNEYSAPAAVALTPDDKYLYVINYHTLVDGSGNQTAGQGFVSVISTATNTIVDTILSPVAIPGGLFGMFGISITPDGKYAYITNFGSNNFTPIGSTVSVIDLKTNTIVKTITLGIQPSGIGITPDGRYVYASNFNSLYDSLYVTLTIANENGSALILEPGEGTVNIIDTKTNKVIPPTIAVDQSPSHIEITPNGEYAYVSNFQSNTVSVIALQSFQITAQGCKTFNRYLSQIDFINRLTWTVTGTSLPVQYYIFRDAELTDLVGTVVGDSESESFEFLDHGRNPSVNYTYYIVGVNKVGTLSDPVIVTVTKDC